MLGLLLATLAGCYGEAPSVPMLRGSAATTTVTTPPPPPPSSLPPSAESTDPLPRSGPLPQPVTAVRCTAFGVADGIYSDLKTCHVRINDVAYACEPKGSERACAIAVTADTNAKVAWPDVPAITDKGQSCVRDVSVLRRRAGTMEFVASFACPGKEGAAAVPSRSFVCTSSASILSLEPATARYETSAPMPECSVLVDGAPASCKGRDCAIAVKAPPIVEPVKFGALETDALGRRTQFGSCPDPEGPGIFVSPAADGRTAKVEVAEPCRNDGTLKLTVDGLESDVVAAGQTSILRWSAPPSAGACQVTSFVYPPVPVPNQYVASNVIAKTGLTGEERVLFDARYHVLALTCLNAEQKTAQLVRTVRAAP